MISSSNETRASLIILSEALNGQQIADRLGVQPTKIILKGTPTDQTDFPENPINMAMFASGVRVEEHLELHIERLLALYEQRKDALEELLQNCRLVIHCSYLVQQQGGWTISPELCRRMASVPIEFVFNVEPLKSP